MFTKFFSVSRPLSWGCRAVSLSMLLRHLNLTKILLVLLVFGLAAGCSQKRRVTKNPDNQFYQEAPQHYLPFPAITLKGAMFLKADRDLRSDLVWFSSVPEKRSSNLDSPQPWQAKVLITVIVKAGHGEFEGGILFLTAGRPQ